MTMPAFVGPNIVLFNEPNVPAFADDPCLCCGDQPTFDCPQGSEPINLPSGYSTSFGRPLESFWDYYREGFTDPMVIQGGALTFVKPGSFDKCQRAFAWNTPLQRVGFEVAYSLTWTDENTAGLLKIIGGEVYKQGTPLMPKFAAAYRPNVDDDVTLVLGLYDSTDPINPAVEQVVNMGSTVPISVDIVCRLTSLGVNQTRLVLEWSGDAVGSISYTDTNADYPNAQDSRCEWLADFGGLRPDTYQSDIGDVDNFSVVYL